MEHIHKFALVLKQMEPVFWSVLLCVQICSHNSSTGLMKLVLTVWSRLWHMSVPPPLGWSDSSLFSSPPLWSLHSSRSHSNAKTLHGGNPSRVDDLNKWGTTVTGQQTSAGWTDRWTHWYLPGSSLLSLPPHPPRLTLLSASLSPHSRCFLSSSSH